MALKLTASLALIEQLSQQHRRVLSDWRALILLRRATFETALGLRRWSQLPNIPADLYPLFRQMEQRGEIRPIQGLRHLYEVTVPYANLGPIEEEEILFEANPYAALSHFSALVFHGLTDQFPYAFTATAPLFPGRDSIPLGTEPGDWEGMPLVRGRMPRRILGRPVEWTQVKPERFFGASVYEPRGYPIRVSNLEKTLLDTLQAPDRAGGIDNVLRAWALARDSLDLNALTEYVERLDIAVLRQRVGFIVEELGLHHPAFERWRDGAHRGGSSRLVGAVPFAPAFSERWQLSLNAPLHALHSGGG